MSLCDEARSSAILCLQRLLARQSPGSTSHRQVEHALNLALSDGRVVDTFFVRNLLRDAGRIIQRRVAQSRFNEINDCIDGPGGLPDSLWERNTPEAVLEARQIVEAAVCAVAPTSKHAFRVMNRLVRGETLAETASEAHISLARVNQLRHMLRRHAGRHMDCAHGR